MTERSCFTGPVVPPLRETIAGMAACFRSRERWKAATQTKGVENRIGRNFYAQWSWTCP